MLLAKFISRFCLRKFLFAFFISFFTFMSFSVLAQGPKGYLEVVGKVKAGKKVVTGDIAVYLNNVKIQSVKTGVDGKFTFKFDIDKQYVVEVASAGFVTKKVLFDTNAPEKDLIYKYSFTVELFELFPGIDVSALSKPITKINYNEDADAFDFDVAYTEQMRKEIDKITNQIDVLKCFQYCPIIL